MSEKKDRAVYPDRLGAQLAVHKNRFPWLSGFLLIFLLFGILLLAILSYQDLLVHVYLHGPAVITDNILFPIILLSLLIILALAAFLDFSRGITTRLILFEHGLVKKGLIHKEILYWDEVVRIRLSHYSKGFGLMRGREAHGCTMESATGRKILINQRYQDHLGLIEAVKTQSYPWVFKHLIQAMKSVGTYAFGPLSIDINGITLHGKQHAWSSLKHVNVENGLFRVEFHDEGRKPKFENVQAARLPNPDILATILEEHRRALSRELKE